MNLKLIKIINTNSVIPEVVLFGEFLVCLLCRQTHGMHLQARAQGWNKVDQKLIC